MKKHHCPKQTISVQLCEKTSEGKYPFLPESMRNQGENLGITLQSFFLQSWQFAFYLIMCPCNVRKFRDLHCITVASFSAQVRYDRPIIIAMEIDSTLFQNDSSNTEQEKEDIQTCTCADTWAIIVKVNLQGLAYYLGICGSIYACISHTVFWNYL